MPPPPRRGPIQRGRRKPPGAGPHRLAAAPPDAGQPDGLKVPGQTSASEVGKPIIAPPTETSSADELIVAKLAAPHGLRGTVKAIPLTDFPEALSRLKKVILEGKERRVMGLSGIRLQGPTLLFDFDGIDTIEAAEALRGALVKIPRSQGYPLPPGHYYVGDIVGMSVVTEDGRSLGTVQDVVRTGSNDVYHTECALIPATREAVTEMDVPGRRMVVQSSLVVEG